MYVQLCLQFNTLELLREYRFCYILLFFVAGSYTLELNHSINSKWAGFEFFRFCIQSDVNALKTQ